MKQGYIWATGGLLAIALGIVWYDQRSMSESHVPESLKQQLLLAPELAKVQGIDISKEGKALSLTRDGEGRWTIAGPEGFPASGEKVVSFLEDIAKLKVIDQVASSADKWPALGLENGATIHFKGEKEASVFKLTLGKERPGGGQYARLGDKLESYLLATNPSITYESKDWELKKLLDVKKGQIQELVFSPQGKKRPAIFSRAKAEDKLALKDGPGADKEKTSDFEALDTLLSSLYYQNRQAIDPEVAKSKAKADRLEAKLFSGLKYNIEVFEHSVAKNKKAYIHISVVADAGAPPSPEAQFIETLMARSQFEIDESLRQRLGRGFDDFVKQDDKKGH